MLNMGVHWIGPFEVALFGVMGVLVFFVLTCLVLMWSLDRKPHTLDFYIRRVFRIYPLSILALIVVVAFHAPTGGTPQHLSVYNAPTIKSFAMQLMLLPGVGQSLLGVMWSLPYEMAMYLLLPVLYFFVRKNFVIWPLLALWGLTVWLTLGVPATGHNFGVAIGYFLPGVMAYVGFERWKPRLPG
jgi:peptidoglycan/LPS O-acetylase OafA/YrhL